MSSSAARSSILHLVCVSWVMCAVAANLQQHSSLEDSFRQCLMSQQSYGGLGQCLGMGAISKLQSLDNEPEFDLIDGLRLSRDRQEFREEFNFAQSDPKDFRSLIDSFSHVFSQRSLHWDMSFLYPGLGMRVAPSASAAGVLEFVLDPQREVLNKHSLKEYGTGRLIARQFLLPFLLGFKFNVATLIPILFGLLALLAKKAIIISKLALIISSAYGLSALLFNSNNKYPQNYHGSGISSGGGFNPGFGGHYNRFPEDEYQEVLYRGMSSADNNNSDQLRLYANLQDSYEREDKSATSQGRNFAWSEDEKIKTKRVTPSKL